MSKACDNLPFYILVSELIKCELYNTPVRWVEGPYPKNAYQAVPIILEKNDK